MIEVTAVELLGPAPEQFFSTAQRMAEAEHEPPKNAQERSPNGEIILERINENPPRIDK